MKNVPNKEKVFIDLLSQTLMMQHPAWKVEKLDADGGADLMVEDTESGKRVFIEFKEGSKYGNLPVSLIFPLNRQKKRLSSNDALFLVTFAMIPSLLGEKLEEIGVLAMEKPSIPDVVGKVQYAMSA
jgi:hypothetical protein